MSKLTKYIDIGFLAVLGCLITLSIYQHLSSNFVLTINFYLGFACWLIVLLFRIINNKRSKAFLICLITLSAFNIISFTIINFAFGNSAIQEYKSIYYILPSVNPIFLIILVIYSLVDRYYSINFYKNVFKKSDSELMEEYKKQAKFYYEKFNSFTTEELEIARNGINEYPIPAQEALDIVITKRKSS